MLTTTLPNANRIVKPPPPHCAFCRASDVALVEDGNAFGAPRFPIARRCANQVGCRARMRQLRFPTPPASPARAVA